LATQITAVFLTYGDSSYHQYKSTELTMTKKDSEVGGGYRVYTLRHFRSGSPR
jgi:hypothetical protein